MGKIEAVLEAIKENDLYLFKFFVNKLPHVNLVDSEGITIINNVVMRRRHPMTLYVIEKNADLNLKDLEGWGPLHVAADLGDIESADLLCYHGAQLDLESAEKFYPVHYAIANCDNKMINYLESEMKKHGIYIVSYKDVAMVK